LEFGGFIPELADLMSNSFSFSSVKAFDAAFR
jgi:hypothetical protein